jgi:hypothetical protein
VGEAYGATGTTGTTIHITTYRARKIPPVTIASSTQTIRTTDGSTSRYSATPPATPLITCSVRDRYRRRFMRIRPRG